MQFIGIIPARYASTRFPGKPLALIAGKAMIQWVYENASQAKSLSHLLIATDDQRILDKANLFGGRAVMTSDEHPSGTDRCFEAAKLAGARIDAQTIIINIQGDEPFIDPHIIDTLASAFTDPEVNIATLVRPFDNDEDLFSETCMKVVTDAKYNAMYFSRSIIPCVRNRRRDKPLHTQFSFLQHIGIYAYRMTTLETLTKLQTSVLEKTESLEQLRWLEYGFKIRVIETSYKGHSVDIPADIDKLKQSFPEVFKSSFQ